MDSRQPMGLQPLPPLPHLPGQDTFQPLPQPDGYPPSFNQHQSSRALNMRPPSLHSQPAPHHHHLHVHRHPGMDMGPVENAHGNMGFHQENERSEPFFTRSYTIYEGFDDTVAPGASSGNWGKKLQRTSRNTRKRKIGLFGTYSAEAQVEERARKRIKALLPSEDEPSPPPLEIPGLGGYSRPVSPHLPPKDLDPFPPLTTLVATGGARNSFSPALLDDLGRMTMDLIESEGEGCRSLGRLFSLLADKTGPDHNPVDDETRDRDKMAVDPDRARRPSPSTGLELDLGIKEEPETPLGATFPHGVNGQSSRHDGRSPSEGIMFDGVPIPAYADLFITPGLTLHEPLRVGDQETFYPTTSMQLAAMSGYLLQIRGVYDDLREYMSQLQQVSVGLAEVDLGRRRVWNALRQEVANELGVTLDEPVTRRAEEEEVEDV